jgi:diguanylate cyclase
MTAASDEHQRTMAFADIALAQIKALRQPASPRHYEIWYTYASGYNPSLNQAINEILSRSGTLAEAEVEQIYETHFAPNRLSDRIDRVGSQVKDEIEQLMAMIGAATGTASSYGESLASVSSKLGAAADASGMRKMVEGLVHATKEMQKSNQTLEARLNASKQEITQLQENLEVVRTESLTDPLTSLANRKFFDEALRKSITQARTSGEQLCLIMTDVDHFKRFNDSFGHLTGDQVLRLVAQSVKQHVKRHDTAARYGGEEFAVVLPGMSLQGAVALGENIRRSVMAKELMKRSTGESLGRVTVSLGVAALRGNDTAATLIERTDGCLYAAKRGGRNRVVSEADGEIASHASKVA